MTPWGNSQKPQVFWHLDTYPTRAAAQADKGPQGIVVESFGKVWLMTISDEKWRSAHGTGVAEIGPLPIVAGQVYSAQLMEAVFTPGMTAAAHIHSGPEAWYSDAPHRDRQRTAPVDSAHPPSIIGTRHHHDPWLDSKGPVPEQKLSQIASGRMKHPPSGACERRYTERWGGFQITVEVRP